MKTIKSALAISAVGALSLFSVAPASALTVADADSLLQVFDCNTMSDSGQIVGLWNANASVSLVNCTGNYLGDAADTGNASTDNGNIDDQGLLEIDESPEIINFTGEADLVLLANPGADDFAGISSRQVYDMGNPSGVRLTETTKTIPANTSTTFTIGTLDEIANLDEIFIDGNDDCGVEAGEHIYVLQRLHVSKAGEYTFRVTDTDPVSSYIKMGVYTPFEDPMIALYQGEFDPANADASVAGCNDDFNDLTIDGFDWSIPNHQDTYDRVFAVTEDDKAIEGHFPVFTATLQPGDYTMLVTTYSNLSASEWANGEDFWGTWEPGSADLEYEIWGLEDGLEEVDQFALASTGVDASFGMWTGLALAGTGAAIAVARRRAVRA